MDIVSKIFIELFDLLSEYKFSSIEFIGKELSKAKVISSFGVLNILDNSPSVGSLPFFAMYSF